MVEINQLKNDQKSAFKPEDIVSNVLGGVAADNSRKRDTSAGVEAGKIIDNARPKGDLYAR
jgi:hypothetical protein